MNEQIPGLSSSNILSFRVELAKPLSSIHTHTHLLSPPPQSLFYSESDLEEMRGAQVQFLASYCELCTQNIILSRDHPATQQHSILSVVFPIHICCCSSKSYLGIMSSLSGFNETLVSLWLFPSLL